MRTLAVLHALFASGSAIMLDTTSPSRIQFQVDPLTICAADPWMPLWTNVRCSRYVLPTVIPTAIPLPSIVAPTPLAPDLPEIPNELESFEDWKKRKEAESAPLPPPEEPSAKDNSSNETAVESDTNPEVNSTAEGAAPQAAPPAPKPGHRYNYASPDCSARVLASSPLTQHASSLLHKSKDRYMLTPCRAEQHWVVIELCDEIRVEAIELAVWEFFSGIVRGVTVSVGDESTGDSWTQVGEFVGKNVRGAQEFTLPEPTSFHRFLRIDFPTFYGSEYYCPVSQLKVFGMNQMEAFKMEQRRAAEASGAKNREREEQERDKEKEKEKQREEEEKREEARKEAEAAALEQQKRVDDERKDRELCELEKLVQQQARRVGIVGLDPSDCSTIPPEPVVQPTVDTAPTGNVSDSTSAETAADTVLTGNATDSTVSPSSTYTAPQGPRTDSSESIYAFIIRRLNALEGNSTLIARYIDEQAKALRAALTRAETRWEVSRILATKEDENRWEAERMRQEDRLGKIISSMEAMRSSMERERRITQRQLRVLTDELGFERRKSLAQLVILLVAIVLGVMSRGDSIDALLRTLANEGRRQRSAPRTTPNRNQKRLSTGPLAGLLIDVASPTSSNITNPSTPTASGYSPTVPGPIRSLPKQTRRPLTPLSSLRRRHNPTSRSFSAEPGTLFDDDELMSPSARNIAQRRKLARTSHLHPIRRRGDESSEAEGRNSGPGTNPLSHSVGPGMGRSAPVSPFYVSRPAFRPLSGHFPSASPAAAAAAVAAVKAGRTVAPEDGMMEEDGASAPESAADSASASDVEDQVARGSHTHLSRLLINRFEEDEDSVSVLSGVTVKGKAREDESDYERDRDKYKHDGF